ncbi:glycosyltransferase [Saxibacter everestensis]|uniref:Glycosyltransferase n=1 Tax=Saxibacter everestensis TaxID=2909229 RepID=A0ABY8QVM9_9MICO|nr:glycosyltransferase [Brevibacteriaceae bacterium ZFBP1038]
MRISMVSEHASPLAALGGVDAGGQNVHVAALSAALARRGHDITVYTRRDDPDLPTRVEAYPGVQVAHIDAGPAEQISKDELLPYIGKLADGIARDWLDSPPDLVHGHFWMSGLAALDAARRGKETNGPAIPVVQTFHALGTVKRRHQGRQDTSPREREWLEPKVGRQVDRIIATCSDEVFELKAMGVDQKNVSIVPCGVDLQLFGGEGPCEPGNGKRRIAAVGRLVPRKGIDNVIAALSHLRRDGIADIELVIAGGATDTAGLAGDAEAQRLMALAARLGVSDQIDWRGQVPREKLPALLRSVDAVVCTPWYEPFGIVPLEAMACGVPVVAATVGGLIDTVTDGVTGIHVPPRDPVALAATLRDLLGNPKLIKRLGKAGEKRVHSRYSWERIAAATEQAYGLATARTVGADRLQQVGGSAL